MSTPFLSVVVPAYNEADKIGHTIAEISRYLTDRHIEVEIIVVDDGSQDGTAKEAEMAWHGDLMLRVLRQAKNRGKGFAVRSGVLEADGQFVLFTDADLSVPLCELEKFWSAFEDGADLVIGSRRLGGSMFRRWAPAFLGIRYDSTIKVHQPFHRELLGETYQGFVRRFLGLGVTDANCGFKCFRAQAAKRVFAAMTAERWGFDAEILLIARRNGLRIVEVEVVWSNGPTSKVNLLTAPLSSLQEVSRIKLNDMKGLYRL
jgi:dolichyl-phosphate beta-glucosyltransferase